MKSPLIFVPDRRVLELAVELPRVAVQGFVTWKLTRRGVIIRENPIPRRNKIVNAGLDDMGVLNSSIAALTTYAACGTGSATPAATDTALQAEVTTGGRAAGSGGTAAFTPIGGSVTEDYWTISRTYVFSEAQAIGNLTEIGLFRLSTGNPMWARHLLTDVGGTPTTIVKTGADQLEITYGLRIFPPVADATVLGFVISGEGSSHDLTIRGNDVDSGVWGITGWATGIRSYSQLSAYTGVIGARTSFPLGTTTVSTSGSLSTYVSGNYYIDETQVWDPSSGSAPWSSVLAFRMANSSVAGLYQIGFSPAINKTNLKRFTFVARRSWGEKP